jgi:hypothetical protein
MSVYSRGNEVIFESDEVPEVRDIVASSALASGVVAGVAARGAMPTDGDVDVASLRPAAAFEVFQGRIFDVAAYGEFLFA